MKTGLEKKITSLGIITVGEWVYHSTDNGLNVTYLNNTKDGKKVEIMFKQSTSYSSSNRVRTESKTKYRVYVILYIDSNLHSYIFEKSATGESKETDSKIELIVAGIEKQALEMGISDVRWKWS